MKGQNKKDKIFLTWDGYYNDFYQNWSIRKIFFLDKLLKKWDSILIIISLLLIVSVGTIAVFSAYSSPIPDYHLYIAIIFALLFCIHYFVIIPSKVSSLLKKEGIITKSIYSPEYWKNPELIQERNKRYAEKMRFISEDIIEMLLHNSEKMIDEFKTKVGPWYEGFFIQYAKIVFSAALAFSLLPYKNSIDNIDLKNVFGILFLATVIFIFISMLWHSYFLPMLNMHRTSKIERLRTFVLALEDIKFLRIQEILSN